MDSFPFKMDDIGQCYALSGVVVGVDTSSGDGTLAYVEVDGGESRPAKVSMSLECSTWEVGDPFDEEVGIVARVSWPSDFRLPYCEAKPVPRRDTVPANVSYDWCRGEPLPLPAVMALLKDPDAPMPEPAERYLHGCFRIVGSVDSSHYPGYDTNELVVVELDSGGTVSVSGPSVCLSLKDENRVDVLASYSVWMPFEGTNVPNRGLGLPYFTVPDARHC